MATYRFRAYTERGELENGLVEAQSLNDATRILAGRGLLPFETVEAGGAPPRLFRFSGLGRSSIYSISDYHEIIRELAPLLVADLPIDQALRLLAVQTENASSRALCSKLHQSVSNGKALSEAIIEHARSAPPYINSIIKAGEARGNLGQTLTELATFMTRQIELRSKIKAALTYPLILAIAALVSISIIVVYLVPALLPLFKENGAPLPVALSILNSASEFLNENAMALTLAAGVSCILALQFSRTDMYVRLRDRTSLRLPFFGSISRDAATATFARVLGTLTQAGVPLIAGLQISADVVSNSVLAQAIRSSIEGVKSGKRLAVALQETNQFPELALRFVSVGEETGRLDQMLLQMAEVQDRKVQSRIDKGMTLLGPSLTLLIGLAIGGLMVSVMSSILSINQIIAQ